MDKHYYLDANAHVPNGSSLSAKSKKTLISMENSYIAHGHPLSPSKPGKAASTAIEKARDRIAKCLNVNSHQIYFTRSCTEANAIVCRCLFETDSIKQLSWSPYEHHSMSGPLNNLFSFSNETIYGELEVDKNGSPIFYPTILNCVFVGVQPEIGLIADFKAIRKYTKGIFVSDLAQAAGKIPLDLPAMGVDVATFGAHKFGGPIGVGFIYAKNPEFISYDGMYDVSGYAQDVPGTPNTIDIVAASLALQDSIKVMDIKKENGLNFRRVLEEGLEQFGCKIICKDQNRIYNTTFARVPGMENGILLLKKLTEKNIHIGLGSACGSFVVQASTTMQALGANDTNMAYVRISQNGDYNEKDAEYILESIYKSLKQLGIHI